MSKLKDMQRALMISCAQELFLSKGIEKVKISDIAHELQIGEATIYRYFGKKQYLVVECTLSLWDVVREEYFSKIEGNSGYEFISCFYNNFLLIFQKHPNFYRFIAELDSYLLTEEIEDQAVKPYDDLFVSINEMFLIHTKKGILDGSLRDGINYQDFYNMSTHSILSLCKKLSMGTVLAIDEKSNSINEISMLIDVLLKYIRK